MICWTHTPEGSLATAADRIRDLLLPTGSSVEERLGHLDMARHSDMCVSLQRFVESGSRTITDLSVRCEWHWVQRPEFLVQWFQISA